MKVEDLVPTLSLGDRVRFSATLTRVYVPTPRVVGASPYSSLSGRKEWLRRVTPAYLPASPREGVIVGARTLYDGTVEYGYEDNPTAFRPDRSHGVYLVATGLRSKHLMVEVEDAELITA